MMEGIINVLKPPGVTSFDVVNRIKKMLKVKKVGHTGTLDPDAVGVLPICLGRATRLVEYMMNDRKFYRGEITLGVETDTQDSQGKVTAIHKNPGYIAIETIEKILTDFQGKIQQIPPMVSAVKYHGKRLYELARQGVEVERKPREVEIYSIKVIKYSYPILLIDVECSKGTYIRTLAHDIGQALGCGAHLSYLIRLKTGEFSLENSVIFQEIERAVENNQLSHLILPVDWGIKYFPVAQVKPEAAQRIIQGRKLGKGDYMDFPKKILKGQLLRVYREGVFIAISEVIDSEAKIIQPVKVFA